MPGGFRRRRRPADGGAGGRHRPQPGPDGGVYQAGPLRRGVSGFRHPPPLHRGPHRRRQPGGGGGALRPHQHRLHRQGRRDGVPGRYRPPERRDRPVRPQRGADQGVRRHGPAGADPAHAGAADPLQHGHRLRGHERELRRGHRPGDPRLLHRQRGDPDARLRRSRLRGPDGGLRHARHHQLRQRQSGHRLLGAGDRLRPGTLHPPGAALPRPGFFRAADHPSEGVYRQALRLLRGGVRLLRRRSGGDVSGGRQSGADQGHHRQYPGQHPRHHLRRRQGQLRRQDRLQPGRGHAGPPPGHGREELRGPQRHPPGGRRGDHQLRGTHRHGG